MYLPLPNGFRLPSPNLRDPSTEELERHEEPIRNALQTQASQWNQGDIPAFMETYVKGDALKFSSAGAVQQGYW